MEGYGGPSCFVAPNNTAPPEMGPLGATQVEPGHRGGVRAVEERAEDDRPPDAHASIRSHQTPKLGPLGAPLPVRSRPQTPARWALGSVLTEEGPELTRGTAVMPWGIILSCCRCPRARPGARRREARPHGPDVKGGGSLCLTRPRGPRAAAGPGRPSGNWRRCGHRSPDFALARQGLGADGLSARPWRAHRPPVHVPRAGVPRAGVPRGAVPPRAGGTGCFAVLGSYLPVSLVLSCAV